MTNTTAPMTTLRQLLAWRPGAVAAGDLATSVTRVHTDTQSLQNGKHCDEWPNDLLRRCKPPKPQYPCRMKSNNQWIMAGRHLIPALGQKQFGVPLCQNQFTKALRSFIGG